MTSSSSSSSTAQFCPRCKTYTAIYDEEHLHVACTSCFIVIEDGVLQANMEFQEGESGPARPVGSYISTKHARAIPGQHHRDALTEEAKTKMTRWAGQMEPPLHKTTIASALRYYQLAVEKKFTRGRRLEYTLGVCMYAACRDEIPRLINDFVAVADLNPFVFVVTLLHFSNKVQKLQKLVDPALYIPRFASLLDFGEKTAEIASTAERIVARMKRDWIHQGRRPSGVSGAALIIAARIHGFERTKNEIASVVRVGGPTIASRLDEFNGTDSASLSVNEFFSFDLPDEADPPCYIRSMREIENSRGFAELVDQANILALELDQQTELVPSSSSLSGQETSGINLIFAGKGGGASVAAAATTTTTKSISSNNDVDFISPITALALVPSLSSSSTNTNNNNSSSLPFLSLAPNHQQQSSANNTTTSSSTTHIPKTYNKRLPQHSEELEQLRAQCQEELAEVGVDIDTNTMDINNTWKGIITLPPDAVPLNVTDGNIWSGKRIRMLAGDLTDLDDPEERRARENITNVIDLTPYETDPGVIGNVLDEADWPKKKSVWDRVHAKFLDKFPHCKMDVLFIGDVTAAGTTATMIDGDSMFIGGDEQQCQTRKRKIIARDDGQYHSSSNNTTSSSSNSSQLNKHNKKYNDDDDDDN
jgi:transcription initiation factor TFIIIB Brf1 subunit/transcription initiation factor TFIIB